MKPERLYEKNPKIVEFDYQRIKVEPSNMEKSIEDALKNVDFYFIESTITHINENETFAYVTTYSSTKPAKI